MNVSTHVGSSISDAQHDVVASCMPLSGSPIKITIDLAKSYLENIPSFVETLGLDAKLSLTRPVQEEQGMVTKEVTGNLLAVALELEDEAAAVELLRLGSPVRSYSVSVEGWFGWNEWGAHPILKAAQEEMAHAVTMMLSMEIDWNWRSSSGSDEWNITQYSEPLGIGLLSCTDELKFLIDCGLSERLVDEWRIKAKFRPPIFHPDDDLPPEHYVLSLSEIVDVFELAAIQHAMDDPAFLAEDLKGHLKMMWKMLNPAQKAAYVQQSALQDLLSAGFKADTKSRLHDISNSITFYCGRHR